MTNEEYIERYIYAVTKRMPRKLRDDVAQELSGLIADMLEARCGNGLPPTEHDVRVVLTELGRPRELAAKYSSTEGQNYLIGPDYFPGYKLVLKIVLLCVMFGIILSGIVSAFTEAAQTPVYELVFEWIGTFVSGIFAAFGIVTVIFAIFQRRGIVFDADESDLDNLPPVPAKNERISRGESIASIVMAPLFCLLFLGIPGIFGGHLQDGVWTTLFQTDVLRSRWIFFVLFMLLGLIDGLFKLIDGRYTRRVAIVTVITNILSIPLACLIFGDGAVINPAFVSGISPIVNGEEIVVRLFANFHTFLLGILIFAYILEIGTTIFKAVRAERQR